MSNTLAISAVTAAVRSLLEKGVSDGGISIVPTTLPLDLAKAAHRGSTTGGLNLFLYTTQFNAAYRNADHPARAKAGESPQPPLALELFYLLTAYEPDGDTTYRGHTLLAAAMLTLHDHPILGAAEIESALAGSGLPDQVERVRITPHPLSVEDLSKLWVIFQAEYRASVAYRVSVLLIDSERPARSPLPVLRRGAQDQGVLAEAAGPAFLYRAAADSAPPDSQPGVRLGDTLLLTGRSLPLLNTLVRFTRHPSAAASASSEIVTAAPSADSTDREIRVPLTNDAAAMTRWAPGLYSVALQTSPTGLPTRSTNEVAFALLPSITVTPTAAPAGDLTLAVTCAPRPRDGQRVLLLFGDRQVAPATVTHPAAPELPTDLTFELKAVAPGSHVVRLRVDNVDSFPVVSAGDPPHPTFDPAQTVVVT